MERVLRQADLGSEELLDAVELACDWIECGMLPEEFLDGILAQRTASTYARIHNGPQGTYLASMPVCPKSSWAELADWYTQFAT